MKSIKYRTYGFLGLTILACGLIFWQVRPWLAETCFKLKNLWPQGSPSNQHFLDAAIFFNPKLAKAYMEKSVPFNKRGDYANGMFYLNQAVVLQPREYLGYRGWLKLYMLHDYEGSVSDLLSYDALTPSFDDYPWGENIYFLLGINYLQLNQPNHSLQYFQRASDVERRQFGSKYVNPYNYLYSSIAYITLHQYPAAVQQLDSLLYLNPKCAEATYYKAFAFYRMKQFQVAMNCAELSVTQYEQGYRHWNSYYNYPFQLDKPAIQTLSHLIKHRISNK